MTDRARRAEQEVSGLNPADPGGWFKSFVESTAILAAVLYGVFYWTLSRFYGEFGLTPEDAGWDLQTTLARFAGVIAYAAIFAFTLTIANRRSEGKVSRKRVLGYAVAGVIGFLAVLLIGSSSWDDRVREGRAASSTGILFQIPTPCVTAEWTEPSKMAKELPSLPFDGSKRLTLLGSQETVTFYVVDTKQVLRVPASMVVLTSCTKT